MDLRASAFPTRPPPSRPRRRQRLRPRGRGAGGRDLGPGLQRATHASAGWRLRGRSSLRSRSVHVLLDGGAVDPRSSGTLGTRGQSVQGRSSAGEGLTCVGFPSRMFPRLSISLDEITLQSSQSLLISGMSTIVQTAPRSVADIPVRLPLRSVRPKVRSRVPFLSCLRMLTDAPPV
jgi:hypothetical protein